MAVDMMQLVDEFYDYFLGLYQQRRNNTANEADQPISGSATGVPFLAFNGIGHPITPEMFTLRDGSFFPKLVTEQFSILANAVMVVDGTTILSPGAVAADDIYNAMLLSSQPLAATDLEVLGAIKHEAEQTFSESVDYMTDDQGGAEYHPAYPTPPDWPVPTNQGVWQWREFKQSSTTTTGGRPPSPPGRPQAPWRWRVVPPQLEDRLGAKPELMVVADLGQVKRVPVAEAAIDPVPRRVSLQDPGLMRVSPVARVGPAALRADMIVARPTTEFVAGAAAVTPIPRAQVMRIDRMAIQAQELRDESKPQDVTSESLTLSFNYCLVSARRPWLSGAFLTARNWYVPRMTAGEYASGTGTGRGALEVLATAALIVKDLVIEAKFSSDETANINLMGKLGPFSLMGRQIDVQKSTLSCSGMQVVGWVFEPLPRLPPNTDPALAATA